MGCLLILIALCMPRIFLLIGWLTGFFAAASAWDTKVWPVLGFFFAPYTTLAYGCCYVYNGGVFSEGWIVLMILAIVFDIGGSGSGANSSSSSH